MPISCSCDREFLSKSCFYILAGIFGVFILIVLMFPIYSLIDLFYIYKDDICFIIKQDCTLEKNIIFGIFAVYLGIIIICFLTRLFKCKNIQKYYRVQTTDNPPEYNDIFGRGV